MYFRRLLAGLVFSATSIAVSARLHDGRLHANMILPAGVPLVDIPDANAPVTSRNGTVLPPYNTTYFFDQLIDHNNPSLGTFKQRFWHTYEFYEAAGPIVLFTPGEVNANGYSGYLTNRTVNGMIAQQQNGSTIVLEHRFYGLSNPYPNLNVSSLKLHTIQQAIDDLVYFAQTVNLPMPGGDSVTPDKAPWVLVGGSYSGALTSWTMVNKPNVFAAGYASSAVVEAILDFWQYFEPVRLNMPKNCSADVEAVISFVDKTFSGKNAAAILTLKENWGLGAVTHLDDVAGALRNNLWDWQSLQPTSGPGATFFDFCDALEVKNGQIAPASGFGLEHALQAWGSFWKNGYLSDLCGSQDAETCLGTYNTSQSFWTDTTVDNSNRSWMWIVCNEVGYLQEGAPVTSPTLVTRLVQPAYDLRQCQQMFSAAFPVPPVPNTARTNAVYRGWDVRIDNLFFANGQSDPWRYATVSSNDVKVPSTAEQPIHVGDGFHCSDLSAASGAIDPTIAAVQQAALASMKTWLKAWKPKSTGGHTTSPRSLPQPFQSGPSSAVKPINAWFKAFGTI
ncbi:serine carboxypeptidase S28-domain-containing protein [Gymnopilus junonius]|uniref:Serine carboxypeptidase S28-domain-containing protein n=1 Tax=Gymnopilus junonius TaxID=109634 RepID=A0A9P5P3L1_GYMJU|nr:serine carboxypeptidase S28-domain-containing protein [Gymnopilus junonius]